MGEKRNSVNTGCPSIDIKRTTLKKIQLKKYNFGIGEKINLTRNIWWFYYIQTLLMKIIIRK